MNPARRVLTEFVLERLKDEPVATRIMLYRALAADLPETALEFKLLTGLADAFEQAQTGHDQMMLNLREGETGLES